MDRKSIVSPLQYLRALAAGIVVISHAGHQAHQLYGTSERVFNFGAMGVDIFFIISGFIMMLVSEKREAAPAHFLLKRFVRIMPIYWLAVLFYVAADLLFDEFSVLKSAEQVLASLAIWGAANGDVVIGVAWTLRFEWTFYACFALALLVGHRHRAILAGLGLLVVVAALNYHKNDGGLLDQMRNWSGGFYEFIFGMAAYAIWKGNDLFSEKKRINSQIISAVIALTMIFASVIFLYQFGQFGAWRPAVSHKQLAWGLPALAVFSAWLFVFSRIRITGIADKVLLHYGDASFTLYLIHFPVLIIVAQNDYLKPFWEAGGFWFFIIAASAMAFLVSSAAYLLVEKPTLAILRRKLLSQRETAIRESQSPAS